MPRIEPTRTELTTALVGIAAFVAWLVVVWFPELDPIEPVLITIALACIWYSNGRQDERRRASRLRRTACLSPEERSDA